MAALPEVPLSPPCVLLLSTDAGWAGPVSQSVQDLTHVGRMYNVHRNQLNFATEPAIHPMRWWWWWRRGVKELRNGLLLQCQHSLVITRRVVLSVDGGMNDDGLDIYDVIERK